MELLVGVLAILIGLLSCFAGYRIFVLLLPVWGFVVGFLLGANAVVEIFGTGFLQDVVGIVVGIIGGAVVAAIAYIWWWLAVVVAIAGLGYAVGYAILPALGIEAGLLSVLLGLAVAAAFAAAAVILRLPRAIVIVLTALWGAGAAVAGVLLMLGQIELEQIGYGGVDAALSQSPLWSAIWLALAIAGAVSQATAFRDFELVPATGRGTPRRPDSRIPGTY